VLDAELLNLLCQFSLMNVALDIRVPCAALLEQFPGLQKNSGSAD
jgi:hypothetical protein